VPHGKGTCNGIRGKIKRIVIKASSVSSAYCALQDHSKETSMLKERFRKAQTLLNTQIIHIIHHPCLTKLSSDKSVTSVFNITHTAHL
jgi:hypothetical protein